jgi:hypothetical protein
MKPNTFFSFPAGPHKVLIELVDANHQTLDADYGPCIAGVFVTALLTAFV